MNVLFDRAELHHVVHWQNNRIRRQTYEVLHKFAGFCKRYSEVAMLDEYGEWDRSSQPSS